MYHRDDCRDSQTSLVVKLGNNKMFRASIPDDIFAAGEREL